MLPGPARLRRREDFTLAVRRGRRSGRSTLVAHYLAPSSGEVPARAGFVVGRAVGNSVVRHRTVRQLRHLVRDRLDRLPAGSTLVVRALPPAAAADSAGLARDLDAALHRLLPTAAAATAPAPTGAAPTAAAAAAPGPTGAAPTAAAATAPAPTGAAPTAAASAGAAPSGSEGPS